MNWRPDFVRYVIGFALFAYGTLPRQISLPVLVSNAYMYPSPPPMNTRPLLVTSAPPLLFGDPRRSGNVTPFSSGLLRSDGLPSPSGTFHAISPVVKLIAVRTAYGGEFSGKPRRVISSAP